MAPEMVVANRLIASAMVIRVSLDNSESPVELLQEEYPDELVR